MPDEGGGVGGTLKKKMGPLPLWGWLAIMTAVAVAYYLYAKHKQGAQQQPATPSSVGQPGVVVINQGDQDTPQGGGPPEPGKPPTPPETRSITLTKDETLGELAKQRHWSAATLQQVEEMNVTTGQGEWTPQTRLTKGQTVIRPLRG